MHYGEKLKNNLGSGVKRKVASVNNPCEQTALEHRQWIPQPTEESFQLRGCWNGKHLHSPQAATLKRNLFINTVVYLEMCCQGGGEKKKKKIIHLRKIKINKNNIRNPGWE